MFTIFYTWLVTCTVNIVYKGSLQELDHNLFLDLVLDPISIYGGDVQKKNSIILQQEME